ncbi:MAG: peptidyl-prolyl cis-trans isomerase [Planctomycetes bacterium]|nr:peptidyl-prolyl cis-trans isomerase [Planctomycetota bacterium]
MANKYQKSNVPALVKVKIETSLGSITTELYGDKAPITVENFLRYINEKFYEGTIFHRIVPGFVIQGGGLAENMKEKDNHDPIKNEADNGVKNERGTLCMARTSVVDSATSQFFINLADNEMLNHKGESPSSYGYAVFGKVTDGMDVVDNIASVATTSRQGYDDVPKEPVVIRRVSVIS